MSSIRRLTKKIETIVFRLFSDNNALVNLVPYGAPVIVLASSVMSLLVFSPICIWKYSAAPKGSTGWRQFVLLSIFAFVDAGTFLVIITLLTLAPVGNIVCLIALRVIYTPILEALLWKLRIPLSFGGIIIVSIIGCVLLTKPSMLFPAEKLDTTHPYKTAAELVATVVGVLQAVLYTIYKVYPDLHWSAWQLLIAPFGIPVTLICIACGFSAGAEILPSDNPAMDIFGLFVIATIDQCARVSRSVASEEGSASIVSLASSLDIPFSNFFAWIFIGQRMDWIQCLGAAFVMASVILSSLPCANIEQTSSLERANTH